MKDKILENEIIVVYFGTISFLSLGKPHLKIFCLFLFDLMRSTLCLLHMLRDSRRYINHRLFSRYVHL